MKGVLFIVLLAVTYGYSAMDAEDLVEAFKRSEKTVRQDILGLRNTNSTDRLLSSVYHLIDRSHRTAHKQEILIRLVDFARITSAVGWALSGTEITVLEGGYLQNYVRLGYNTTENEDFRYTIDIYGTLVCDD